MSTENRNNRLTIVAGADFRSSGIHKALVVAGTIAGDATAVGILKTKPNNGEHCAVAYEGIIRAYAGAAISAGASVTVTTSGFIVSTGSASGTTVGKALEAANSGDLFKGLYSFARSGVLS